MSISSTQTASGRRADSRQRGLADLYAFLTRDIGGLGIPSVDTFLVGRAVKRPSGSGAVS
ncbi:hypothetical protein ACU4GG_05495 [Streptomyces nojiriensis]